MSSKEVNPKGGKLRLVTRLPTQERLEEQAKQLMHDFPESYAHLTFQDVKIRLMKEYVQETWQNDIYIILVYPERLVGCATLYLREQRRRLCAQSTVVGYRSNLLLIHPISSVCNWGIEYQRRQVRLRMNEIQQQ